MPAPVDLFTKLLENLWALVGAFAMIIWNQLNTKINNNYKNLDRRIDAVKSEGDRRDTEHSEELILQRSYIAKLFDANTAMHQKFMDSLDSMKERSEDRHLEIMKTIHEGLAGKQDRNH